MTPQPPRAPRLGSRRRTDPSLTFAKLPDIMSGHCGIVLGIQRLRPIERSLRSLHGYAAELESATLLGSSYLRERRTPEAPEAWRQSSEGRIGTRVAYDRTRALARAVGEALERYACCIYDPSDYVTGSHDELRDVALDPRICQGPAPDEYAHLPEYAPFEPGAPMRWTWSWSLRDARHVLVPAQLCNIMYNPIPGEPMFQPASSTGWALHHTAEEAIHTGLREIVERDSFALMWLNRLQVPVLDLDSVADAAVARFREDMAREGADVRVLVTTTDVGIASFAVMAIDRREGRPAFLLTTAAHPDPVRALRQACEEAAMVHVDFRARVRAGFEAPARMEDIRRMSEHAQFYLVHENLRHLEWMIQTEGRRRADFADIPNHASQDVWTETRAIVDGFAKAGLDTLYVDTTPPDLREAGWRTAKIIVPGSVRHEYGYGARLLDCKRIYEAPARMGLRAGPTTRDDINPDAHPYS